MSFLGRGSRPSGSKPPVTRVTPGIAPPNLGGPRPANVAAPTTQITVCPHCGKDPTRPPVGSAPEVIKLMFTELAHADNLTAWEDKFITDVESAYEKYGRLSPKQLSILEKIHTEKVVNNGK